MLMIDGGDKMCMSGKKRPESKSPQRGSSGKIVGLAFSALLHYLLQGLSQRGQSACQ